MLKLADISKYYRSNHNVALGLHKINLTFERGDFVAITGESGSGKSTLLNVISGSDTYEEGEMYYEGKETSYYDEEDWENYRKEKIGFIYQNYNLIDSFSCLDNVLTAILIRNPAIPENEAEAFAKKCLAEVGLEKQEKKKASHLSSGQKQRLSIARALAKDTDILVADEPTGNLDVENSRQIIEILAELSKKKLVIIVTHNYDEVETYATRKIRMYDGEVAEDIRLKPNQRETILAENKEDKEDAEKTEDAGMTKNRKKPAYKDAEHALARKMSRKIRGGRPHSTAVLILLVLFLFASIYIFLGSFLKSIDYSTAKEMTDRMYVNLDDARISIRKSDGSVMTEKDFENISNLKYVRYADLYDVVNDYSYFLESDEGKTYQMKYRYNGNNQANLPEKEYVELKDYSHTLKTVSGMTQKDLTEGSLPQESMEIVINSRDKSLIGTTVKIYLSRKYNWENSNALCYEMKITGITNLEEENQIFVSEKLANMLGMISQKTSHMSFQGWMIGDGYGVGSMLEYQNGLQTEYMMEHPIYVINEELTGNQVRLSKNCFADIFIHLTRPDRYIQQKLAPVAELVLEDGIEEERIEVEVLTSMSEYGNFVVEVSRELWEKLYPDAASRQVSVYLEDYAYMDRALRSISDAGYEGISVMRCSGGEYLDEKVMEQTGQLGMSLAALVFVFVAGILLIRVIMSNRKKDYRILLLLGMNRSGIDRMNALEITYHALTALVATILLVNLAKLAELPYIASAVRYYEWKSYGIYAIVVCFMMVLLYKSMKLQKKKGRREV